MDNAPLPASSRLAAGDDESVAALAACVNLIATFFQLFDTGRASEAAELFAADGEMVTGRSTVTGIDALREALRARERDPRKTVHFSSVPFFSLISPNEAVSRTYLQLFVLSHGDGENGPGPQPAPDALTRLDDRFIRMDDGTWRFTRRTATVLAGGG